MNIKVLFFGLAHDLTAFGEEQLELAEGQALGDLRHRYESRFPKLREMGGSLLMAVNQEVRDGSWPLADGDEVAFLPPVSGGHDGPDSRPDCHPEPVRSSAANGPEHSEGSQGKLREGSAFQSAKGDFFRLTRDPIPTSHLAEQLKAPEDGAVVVFEGIVRNHLGARRTLYLEYEGYEQMAVSKMEEIGREARARFGIDRIGITHRLGRIEIGESSVAIIVTSEHRRAAFEACHYAIDRLKQVVPIWKKEYFEDGAVWAEGEGATEGMAGSLRG